MNLSHSSYTEELLALIEEGEPTYEKVKELLAQGADSNAKNRYGATPLLLAAERGFLELCWLLLEHGADLHATNKQGSNALLISAKEHHHAVSMYLIEQGIEVDQPNMIGITPLFWAADSGDQELCEVLIATLRYHTWEYISNN